MGSLSVADPPSMEAQVHEPLSQLEASFSQLITSFTNSPAYSTAPSAAHSVLAANDSLTSALHTLYTHQNNYARILRLRAEASRLEDSIKATIRTCIDLRREIGNIHPSILAHSGEEEEGDKDEEANPERRRDVNYHTLLSFASKIGKHNSAAAKEAEEESLRRLSKARSENRGAVIAATNTEEHRLNGNTPAARQPVFSTSAAPATNVTTTTPPTALQDMIPQNERDWLDAEAAMTRARSGMAFPAAENLRKGMLGRLQWIREQSGGEEAVEREVEKMITEAEGRPWIVQVEGEQPEAEKMGERNSAPAVAVGGPTLVTGPLHGSGQRQGPRHAPEKKKSVVVLDLDLYNEEDDEDED